MAINNVADLRGAVLRYLAEVGGEAREPAMANDLTRRHRVTWYDVESAGAGLAADGLIEKVPRSSRLGGATWTLTERGRVVVT